MTAITDSDRATAVRALAESRARDRGPLLPILHDVVAAYGYVDQADLPVIAGVLNLSVAEVHGVVTFYHDFRTVPPAAHRVAICRGEACQSVGAEGLYSRSVAEAQTDAWGDDVEVAQVFCLGNCALGPAGTVDGRLHGLLTVERLGELTRASRS